MPDPTANEGHVDELLSGGTGKKKPKAKIPSQTAKAADLPADAFALIGDRADRSTWRHPLWKTADGVISQGRLHAAMGALARMDDVARAEASPRIAKAYRALYPDRRLPAPLAKAEPRAVSHGVLVAYDIAKATRLYADVAEKLVGVQKADLSPADARSQFMDAVGSIPDDEVVPCMIGFGLPSDIAMALELPDSDGVLCQAAEDMHVTLAYVRIPAGRVSQALTLVASAMRAACSISPFGAEVSGVGIFIPDTDDDDDDNDAPLAQGEDDGDADSDGPWYTAVALIDSIDLSDLRADLIEQLNAQGLPVDDFTHGFVPHVTLATATDPTALQALPLPESAEWIVDSFCVAVGGVVAHFPLIGGWAEPMDDQDLGPSYVQMAVGKSDAAKRYTFAPMYVPGRLDTHKEWITEDSLQEAQWDYVRCGDRTVNLQHFPGTDAGEWVDLVTWPYPVTCELATVDGVRKSVEVPAGTVWMGVVWNDFGWEKVLRKEIQGLSLEGFTLYDDATPPA